MDVIDWFVNQFSLIISVLNSYKFANIPIFTLLSGFILLSMIISVFWRGARG